MKQLLAPMLMSVMLTGCISTVGHVVTAPVRAASWGVDKMTTSQSEADRNRGRRERKAEKREAEAQRKEDRRAREEALRNRSPS